MPDRWMISRHAVRQLRLGTPVSIQLADTHGHCEAIEAGHIEKAGYNRTGSVT
jgi:hypothetical protein